MSPPVNHAKKKPQVSNKHPADERNEGHYPGFPESGDDKEEQKHAEEVHDGH
jgi:hypothetical protein